MTTTDPLSLTRGEAPRRATRTRCCCAPRGRPTSRRRSGRSSASTTARRPPTSSSPSRAASGSAGTRSSASGRGGCSRSATAGPDPGPARHRRRLRPRTCRSTSPRRPIRSRRSGAFVPRRRVQPTEGMPRFTGGAVGALAYDAVSIFEPTVPLPERDPVGVADGGVHRDRPRPRLRPPDPHAVGDRLAPHRGARPRGPLPDRRGRRSSRRSSGPPGRRAAEMPAAAARRGAAAATAARRRATAIETSLGRDEYVHAVEVAKDAIAAGEAIQVVLARRQSFDLPTDPATGAAARRDRRSTAPPPRQPEPVPVLRPGAVVRGRRREPGAPRSRSRATSSRPTRSPARAPVAPRARGRSSSPSSSSATRRSGRST